MTNPMMPKTAAPETLAGIGLIALATAQGIETAIRGPNINKEVEQERLALLRKIQSDVEELRRLGVEKPANFDGASLDSLRTIAREMDSEVCLWEARPRSRQD